MVTADFSEAVYSFSEGAGQSSGIAVVLSNRIAQDLSISIHAGMYLLSISVMSSGFPMLTFSQHNFVQILASNQIL